MNADIRLDHCNAADFKVKQHLFEIRKLFVELALFDDVAVGIRKHTDVLIIFLFCIVKRNFAVFDLFEKYGSRFTL